MLDKRTIGHLILNMLPCIKIQSQSHLNVLAKPTLSMWNARVTYESGKHVNVEMI